MVRLSRRFRFQLELQLEQTCTHNGGHETCTQCSSSNVCAAGRPQTISMSSLTSISANQSFCPARCSDSQIVLQFVLNLLSVLDSDRVACIIPPNSTPSIECVFLENPRARISRCEILNHLCERNTDTNTNTEWVLFNYSWVLQTYDHSQYVADSYNRMLMWSDARARYVTEICIFELEIRFTSIRSYAKLILSNSLWPWLWRF